MFGSRSFLRRQPVRVLLTSLIFSGMVANGAPPLWWSAGDPPVWDETLANPGANLGVANIGQAKHMVQRALETLEIADEDLADEIRLKLTTPQPSALNPSQTNPAVLDLAVPSPKTPEWIAKQKAPLLIGQLKAIAKPFYDVLHAADPTWLEARLVENQTKDATNPSNHYPWSSVTTDDQNKAPANIGQLKAVFSLPLEELNPNDTDGDGMPNQWEEDHGLDPDDASDAPADGDGDGLSNLREFQLGTDPNNSDTDGDHVSDGAEVLVHFTNPLSASDADNDGVPDDWEVANELIDGTGDQDDDGLSDANEFSDGTDPYLADTDMDGMSDKAEIQAGYDPADGDENNNGQSDGYEDDDSDGYVNHAEAKSGTNPKDGTKKPDGVTTTKLLITGIQTEHSVRIAGVSKWRHQAPEESALERSDGKIVGTGYKYYLNTDMENVVDESSEYSWPGEEGSPGGKSNSSLSIINTESYGDDHYVKVGDGPGLLVYKEKSDHTSNGSWSHSSSSGGSSTSLSQSHTYASGYLADTGVYESQYESYTKTETANGVTQTYTSPGTGPNPPSGWSVPQSLGNAVTTETVETTPTTEIIRRTGSHTETYTGGGSKLSKKSTQTMTWSKEYTDAMLESQAEELMATQPYNGSYGLALKSCGGFGFIYPNNRDSLLLFDLKYKVIAYDVPQNVTEVTFLWDEVTMLQPDMPDHEPVSPPGGGGEPVPATPVRSVVQREKTVTPSMVDEHRNAVTDEYHIEHPKQEGTIQPLSRVESTFQAPSVLRVDHDTKDGDLMPSNLREIRFHIAVPPLNHPTGGDVILDAAPRGNVVLWKKVNKKSVDPQGNSTISYTFETVPWPYTLKAEQKAGTMSNGEDFFLQGKVAGNVTLSLALSNSSPVATPKVVRVIDLDLDTDSDNSGDIDHSKEEEEKEDLAKEDGKVVVYNGKSDADDDDIPNHADLDDAGEFTEITVRAANLLSTDTISFSYSGSDPSAIVEGEDEDGNATYKPAPGMMRIWKVNGDSSRSVGDYIAPGAVYSLTDLGMTAGEDKTFYVEVVRPAQVALAIQVASQGVQDLVTLRLIPVEVVLHRRGSIAAPGASIPRPSDVNTIYEAVTLENADYDEQTAWVPNSMASAAETNRQDGLNHANQPVDQARDDDFVKLHLEAPMPKMPGSIELVMENAGRGNRLRAEDLRFYNRQGERLQLADLRVQDLKNPQGPLAPMLQEDGLDLFLEIADLGQLTRASGESNLNLRRYADLILRLNLGGQVTESRARIYRGGYWRNQRNGNTGTNAFYDGKGRYQDENGAWQVDVGTLVHGPYNIRSGTNTTDATASGAGPTPLGWYGLYERTDFRTVWEGSARPQTDHTVGRNGTQLGYLQQGSYCQWSAAGNRTAYTHQGSNPPATIRFKFQLVPNGHDAHGRDYLQVHPDGFNDGTAGCVGMQTFSDCCKMFFLMRHYYGASIRVENP